jgi:hypothetical protein
MEDEGEKIAMEDLGRYYELLLCLIYQFFFPCPALCSERDYMHAPLSIIVSPSSSYLHSFPI